MGVYDFTAACTELLQRPLSTGAGAGWQSLLEWLLPATGAAGARLDFVADQPGLRAGSLREDVVSWLDPGAGGREARLAETPTAIVLQIPLADEQDALIAALTLELAPAGHVPPEQARLLAATLQTAVKARFAAAALSQTRDTLSRFRHLYEVGQVITSTLDLDQVLKQSTERVTEVLRAEASTLMLIDEAQRELVFKIPAGPAEQILHEQRMPMDKGVAGWAVTYGQPVIIPDVQADKRFYMAIDQKTGYQTKSIMAVPLQVKGKIIGVVEVINKVGGGSFTEDDQQWLSILTPLIAVAIDNARLFAVERQRVSELAAANTVAAALNETLDLPVMLRSALLTTMDVLRAEGGEIGLRNPQTHQLEFLVQESVPCDGIARFGTEGQHDLARWIVQHGEPLILPDVAADSRGARLQSSCEGVLAYAGVPLRAHENITGVLSVMSTQAGAFDGSQLPLLDTIGRQIGLALENARLYVEVREERDRIVAAEETVRHELERNLHDGPAQIISAIILNIDMARRQLNTRPEKMATELNYLESLATQANQETRDLLFNLRPLTLESHGLIVALRQLVERTQAHETYRLHFNHAGLPVEIAARIDIKVSSTLFVIVQEALNNIHKHAKPDNVWITAEATSTDLWISVADDGVGFDVALMDKNYGEGGHFGLLNMRERARLISGFVEIISPRPGSDRGTLVRVRVPLERALQAPANPA